MIVPPIPTPFDENGRPDWGALASLVDALEPHVDGFLLYGSTGESVHLTPEERNEGLAVVRRDQRWWVGVIEEATTPALAAASHARDAGASGLLATPPRYYGGGAKRPIAISYFEALAGVGTPLWLYHVPQMSKVDFPVDFVVELAGHENVAGIKDSSGDLGRLAAYASHRLDFTVLTGHAPTLLGALALGASGGILAAANVAAPGYRKIVDAHRDGRIEEAADHQRRLEPLGRLLALDTVPLVKQTLRHLGLPAGTPRHPYPSESPHWDRLRPLIDRLRESGDLVA